MLLRALSFLAIAALLLAAKALPDAGARRRFVVLSCASPMLLVYSAEARPYALLSALGLALFLLSLTGEERRPRLAAAAILAAAALYTHYLAIFLLGSLAAVALARRRFRSAAALFASAALFAPWVPVFLRQPAEAVAWMHEPLLVSAGSFLSALGGVGRLPDPLGGPLPRALVWAALAVGALLSWAVTARREPAVRDAAAVALLTLAAVLAASALRPLAFPGRTELTVLPIWLWAVAGAATLSPLARGAAVASGICGAAACALVLAAPRPEPTYAHDARELAAVAQAGDLVAAAGAFYLPVRLEADRRALSATLIGLPAEIEKHPGWIPARRLAPDDLARLASMLHGLPPGSRGFVLLPAPLATADAASILAGIGRGRVIAQDEARTLWLCEGPAAQ